MLPGAKKVWTVRAESHFDAMTKYYEHMGWGAYTTEHASDYENYPDEWLRGTGNGFGVEDEINVQPDLSDVSWLLHDLRSKLGYCTATRNPERFMPLVAEGPESFADAVLVAEGLDPALEKRLRRGLRDFVAERFELWASRIN